MSDKEIVRKVKLSIYGDIINLACWLFFIWIGLHMFAEFLLWVMK